MSLSAPSLSPHSDPHKGKVSPTLAVLTALRRCKVRNAHGIAVAVVLAEHMRPLVLQDGRTCTGTWAGATYIGTLTGLHKNTVNRTVRELVRAGVFVKVPRRGPLTVRYADGPDLLKAYTIRGHSVLLALARPLARVVALRPDRWPGVADVAVDVPADWPCPHVPHCGHRAGCERQQAVEAGKLEARSKRLHADLVASRARLGTPRVPS